MSAAWRLCGSTGRRWLLFWGLMLVLAALGGYANGLGRVDAALMDRIASMDRRDVSPEVVIVEIDDRSLVALGRWPWRREVHAPLVDRLAAAGARVIGLHLVVSDADRAADSEAGPLAAAIGRAGNVVLPLYAQWPEGLDENAGLPHPDLVAQARGMGHIHLNLDPDGVTRSVMRRAGTERQQWDHWVFALLDAAGEGVSEPGKSSDEEAREGPAITSARAWQQGPKLLIPYAGPPGRVPRLSYIDVLRGRVPPEQLRGKFVLVGPTAPGLNVSYATPTRGSGALMPAVEVSAQLLDAQLQNVQRRRATAWENTLFSVVPVLVAALVLMRWRPRDALASLVAQLLLLVASTWLLRRCAGIQVAPLAALLSLLLVYPLWAWWRLMAVVRYLGEQFQRVQDDTGLALAAPQGSVLAGDAVQRHMSAMAAGLDRLREVQRQRDEALRYVSHDLRAPHSAIVTLLERERERQAPAADPQLLARIEGHARRALGLAEDFVQLARAQGGDYQLEAVNLADVLIEAADRQWEQANARSVRVLTDTAAAPAWCLVDRELLTRAVANLIDNAIKYGPQGAQVRCSLQAEGAAWRLLVRDEGPGVAPASRPGLFDAFRRLPASGPVEGAGLGLAFVQAVVARHGGSVQVLGEAGEGGLFCIELPALDPSAAHSDALP